MSKFCQEGKHADPKKIKKTKDDHENPCENDENDKALVTKVMTLSNIGNDIFIGDSAATSHMTNNNTGVYELTPIRGSVMRGNGESISCTHKGKLDVICKHRDGSMTRETWEVKIVPQLNHVTGFYPSPKSFWSCTHVNSCQKYALYINLHILLNISSKTTSNIQESRKSIKRLSS